MSGRGNDGSVDLREVGLALRRGWYYVVAGAILGLALAVAATQIVRERYEASATVLVRSSPDFARSALSGMGALGDLLGGMGGMDSELNTELEILTSRSLVGQVVDSLLLQAAVRSPEGMAPSALFDAVRVEPAPRSRRYEFERAAEGYRVRGDGVAREARPGSTLALPGAVVTLRSGPLPDRFTVDLMDREDAITAVRRSLRARTLTADVAEIAYRGGDPLTSATVPNLLVSEYLKRRQTTDRGTNQHRFEFLVDHADSVTVELAHAESALRRYQEATGVIDPVLTGETQLRRAMELQGELETIEMEAGALRRILATEGDPLPPRELAAFPTFLRNAAINDVLSRLLELETTRLELSQRRTEADPDVIALTQSIEHLEGQLQSLSSAYLGGLGRQRAEVAQELQGYRADLARLPEHAEEHLRLQREVKRLSEIQLVLHGQLVQARLAAMGEGGEVRQIDAAIPPKRPAFPSRGFVLLTGVFGGVFFGMVAAVGGGLMRQRVREPWQAELATGVPATAFATNGPLAFPELRTARTILLLPADGNGDAREVGEGIVRTASLQGREAVLADLGSDCLDPVPGRVPVPAASAEVSAGGKSQLVVDLPTGSVAVPLYHGGGSEVANRPRAMLAQLEERFSLVVAVVPRLDHPAALSVINADRPVVLVAGRNAVTSSDLSHAVQAVERMGGVVAGVVLRSAAPRRDG